MLLKLKKKSILLLTLIQEVLHWGGRIIRYNPEISNVKLERFGNEKRKISVRL